MYFGAQYYRPPFPDRTCWERDFLNMKQLGFHVVKLWAVWNDIERKPDHFVFDDLDRLTELAGEVDITLANLSILKNNKAKAVRLSTLNAICKALDCQPGDILQYVDDEEDVENE